MPNDRETDSATSYGSVLVSRLVSTVGVVYVVSVALMVSPQGEESFRYPKEVLTRAAAICFATALAIGTLHGYFGRSDWNRIPKAFRSIVLAALGWTALTAVLSTNRTISLLSLLWLGALALLFLGLRESARRHPILVLAAPLIGTAFNAIAAVGQATRLWSPVELDPAAVGRMRVVGYLGNPNDLSAYLVLGVLFSAGVAISRPQLRLAAAGAVLIGIIGILLCDSLTATAALVAGGAALLIIQQRARLLLFALPLIIVTTALMTPLRSRAEFALSSLRSGNIDQALSLRTVPFRAAWRMFRDSPIVGLGAGTYGWNYFDYKLAVEKSDPTALESEGRLTYAAEAHNDHLQILAETGFPGYLIFLTAWGLMASASIRFRRSAGIAARDARSICLPVAVSLFVLCLAQFPLRLAATTSLILLTGAVASLGWSEREGLENSR